MKKLFGKFCNQWGALNRSGQPEKTTSYIWHMNEHGWGKIIEKVEKEREKKPVSIKDVFNRHFSKVKR